MSRSHFVLISLLFLILCAVPAHAWEMEAGTIDLPETSTGAGPFTVSLKQQYDTPPVIVALPTDSGANSAALRIDQVSTTDFRISQWEPKSEDGGHFAMTVRYVAVEPGVHTLPDGTQIEADTVSTRPNNKSFVQFNGEPSSPSDGARWGSKSFNGSFSSAPALVAAIQSANNESAINSDQPSDPWLTTAISSQIGRAHV